MTSHVLIRLVIAGFALAVPLAGTSAQAQADSANRGGAAATAPKRVPIAKSIFGDAGVIVNARDDGFIEVAIAGATKTVLLQLRTMAARAWVDSTTRMLRARPRRSNTPRTYRSDIDEAGSSSTMAVTRKVTAGESEYAIFVSDDPLGGFSVPIERSEADVFVAQIRRAVAQSEKLLEPPDTAKKADSTEEKPAKPATKRPARPPAPKPSAQPAPKTTTPA